MRFLSSNFPKSFLLLLGAFFASTAFAQSAPANSACACPTCVCPTPGLEEEKEKGPWSGNINFGYNQTSGNRDTDLLNIGGKLGYETEDNISGLTVLERYGQDENDTNIDDTDANAQWKHLYTKHFYINSGLFFRRDEIADVRYRIKPGIFPGYFLLRSKTLRFNVEAGPTYIWEEVAGVEDDYFAPEVAQRLEWDFSKNSSLFEETRINFDINDSDNYLVKAIAGVSNGLTETLSLIIGVSLDYDGEPGIGLESENLAFTTAIAYNFL